VPTVIKLIKFFIKINCLQSCFAAILILPYDPSRASASGAFANKGKKLRISIKGTPVRSLKGGSMQNKEDNFSNIADVQSIKKLDQFIELIKANSNQAKRVIEAISTEQLTQLIISENEFYKFLNATEIDSETFCVFLEKMDSGHLKSIIDGYYKKGLKCLKTVNPDLCFVSQDDYTRILSAPVSKDEEERISEAEKTNCCLM
jgi:hypothetical protein